MRLSAEGPLLSQRDVRILSENTPVQSVPQKKKYCCANNFSQI